jgi:FkbM family methyltransferase
MASSIVGKSGRVYSFECSDFALRRLSLNTESHGLGNVLVVPKALWSSETKLPLYLSSKEDGLNSLIGFSTKTASGRRLVETTTIDAAIGEQDVIQIAKIDVEGAEVEVLKGADDLLKSKRIRNIIVEWAPSLYQGISDWESRFLFFKSIGQVFKIVDKNSRKEDYQLIGPLGHRKELPISSVNLLVRPYA